MKLSREQMNSQNSAVVTKYGRIVYPSSGDLVSKSLELYGEWADGQIQFLQQFLQPGDAVVEIGAHAGIHTLALAQSVSPEGIVYAFESKGPGLEALRSTMLENGVTNVEVREFEDSSYQSSPGAEMSKLALSAKPALEHLALMTIDMARAGGSVIDCFRDMISRHQPLVFVEFEALEQGHAALSRLSAAGYSAHYVRTPAFNKSNACNEIENIFGIADDYGILFLPRGLKLNDISLSFGSASVTLVEALEDLAAEFLATPRYGDRTNFNRTPKLWRSELARLRFQLAEANIRFQEASSSLVHAGKRLTTAEDLRSRLKTQDKKLKEYDEKIKIYKKKLKASEALIHQLYNSTSWKFARPIRVAQKAAKALRLKTAGLLRRTPAPSGVFADPKQKGAREKQKQSPRHVPQKARTGGAEKVSVDTSKKVEVPSPPSWEAWEKLSRSVQLRSAHDPKIDIVVPVYGQARETLNCLFHVLNASQKTAYELVVIDDCGPDPDLSRELERLASLRLITLLRNEANLGFVATVNRGMALHGDRDVLLLNSDTAVHGDWLDRIIAFAESNPEVGTITPLSNNATICSYPKFVSDNNNELEIDDATLDQIAARVNAGKSVDIPTAVGFCMYINRACINDVGLFDVETFGRGYGEENDFCRRAVKKGWSNVLIGNVFIRHYGGASFGESKKALAQEAQRRLEALHPEYSSTVREFILNDPVLDLRQSLDIERLRLRTQANGPAMLFITLGRGGGTERHLEEMQQALEVEGVPSFILRSNPRQPGSLQFDLRGLRDVPNLPSFSVPYEPTLLIETINKLNIKHIHVQHLADAGDGVERMIREAADMAGIQYDVTVHDYMYICPRITLISHSGVYCGEPEPAGCNTCLATLPSIAGNESIEVWREKFRKFLAGARVIYVPSTDVATRMNTYFPQVTFTVRPHVTVLRSRDVKSKAERSERHVAIIGAIGPHKGAALIAECARYALSQQLPIRFIIVGYISDEYKLHTLSNVTITGRYDEGELQHHLAEQAPDIAWFPSVLPETFSYTLSSAIEAGILPVVFDLGTPAERLRALHWGGIMPAEYMLSVPDILQFLLSVKIEPAPQDLAASAHVSYKSVLQDYYDLDLSQQKIG